MTVTPDLNPCEHGYAETEHCRACEIMNTCQACCKKRFVRDSRLTPILDWALYPDGTEITTQYPKVD